MTIAPVADVKARLSAFIDQAEATGPVVITRNGKAVALLIAPADDDELEHLMLANSPKFLAMLDRSRKSIAEGKGIPAKEFWQQVRAQAKARTGVKAKTARSRAARS